MSPSVRLVPMTAEQFPAYRELAEREYAENIETAGMMPEEEVSLAAYVRPSWS